jgi:hypothetical protein
MNDPAIFQTFLQQRALVTVARARNAIISFIPTFEALLHTSEDEINDFVKSVHAANTALTNNNKIYISPSSIITILAVLFELKDREKCNALPNEEVLQAIDNEAIQLLRRQRSIAIDAKKTRNEASLPPMDIPKFTGSNFTTFHTAFASLASRHIGANDLPLDYILRLGPAGDYGAPYTTRELKLKACITFTGDNFRVDRESIYSLYVQHIGTTGIGSTIVNRYKRNKDGYRCFLELNQHFNNSTYKQNRATTANTNIANASYRGDRHRFTIETYYTIMTTAFNELEEAGAAHALTEEQKIQKFESGIQDQNALNFAITAKSTWDALNNPALKTFDTYYNDFSSKLDKWHSLLGHRGTQHYNNRPNSRISNLNTNGANTPFGQPFDRGGRFGRGGGRGRGRGRGSGRFQGRGGRFGRGYGGRVLGRFGQRNHNNQRHNNSPGFAPIYGNFMPEAKVYDQNTFRNLTYTQKKQVMDLKTTQGWIDQTTPPPGFTIDANTGHAIPSNAFISAVRTAQIGNMNQQPPPMFGAPPSIAPPPPFINIPPPPLPPRPPTDSTQAGSRFGRTGSRTNNGNDNASISAVTINGRQYDGPVFDQHGNVIN